MFSADGSFDLADFGAWTTQINSDFELKFERPLKSYIDDLVGVRGMSRPTDSDLKRYVDYFRNNSNFNWDLKKIKNQIKNSPLILADLGSVLDVLVIESLFSKEQKISALEIGGGYGRLAPSVVENRGDISEWNLLDVLPSSLALANSYLRLNGLQPSLSMGDDTLHNTIRLSQISKLHMIQEKSIDLIVNIESFQEMTQEWVSFWIEVINQKAKKGAYFYHSNSFNYKNNFHINLGPTWDLVRSIESPRHWTTEHLTEVWVKTLDS